MDRGAWWAAIRGDAQSRTRLSVNSMQAVSWSRVQGHLLLPAPG